MNAHPIAPKILALVPVLLLTGLSSGCASPTKVRQYQEELRDLREKVADLEKERRNLLREQEEYETRLAEASVQRETQPSQDYPELQGLGGVDVFRQDGNVVISIASSVTFPSGKAELTRSGKDTLRKVADALRENPEGGEFWIEGHTDDDPIKKSKWASNRELSIARAMAVLHFLVEECGIPDENCVVVGHGQYHPVVPNSSSANKAKNRRVEIVVRAPSA